MTSLADRIAVLTNPAPEIVDPEDDINVETSAKLCKKDNEDHELIDQVSSLRSRNAPLLDEVDQRYAGKPISRKNVDDQNKSIDDFDSAVDEDDDDNDEENSDEQDDDFTIESFREQIRKKVVSDGNTADLKISQLGDDDKDDDSEEENDSVGEGHGDYDDNEDDSDTAGGSEDEVKGDDDDESDDNMVQKFSNIDVNSEIKKGKAVELQQELWNRLCECRIQLQKLLLIANKLPQFDTWNQFKQHSDALYTENVNKGYKATQKLLMNLLDLQESIMTSDPELTMDISAAAAADDDEEIPSDSDEEKDVPKSSVNKATPRKRKLKDEDYRTILAKRHRSLIPYRNSVIQKWDEKTRLASGRMTQRSVNVQDQSTLKQIEEILQGKDRLIKRTQMKRSVYRVLGKSKSEDSKVKNEEQTSDSGTKNYDPEIFDDSDFYGQLLKDIIECKSTGMDPAVLNAQLEIQKMRSKLKKKPYDTKASKGRKIKYIVHPKLLNFMAPAVTHGMPDMARDELFKSLFGQ